MRYNIEQLELHVSICEVEADSREEAIAKVLNGEGEIVDTNFSEVLYEKGMSIEEAKEDYGLDLNLLDSLVEEDVSEMIPSIQSIEEVDE